MGKVLYIDDSYGDSLLASKELREAGYEVTTASNPALALQILSNEKFDLIVSDVFMGKDNGLEFIKSFNEAGGNTPIYLTSGVKDMVLLQKYKEIPNFCGFIPKPLRAEFLKTRKGNGDEEK